MFAHTPQAAAKTATESRRYQGTADESQAGFYLVNIGPGGPRTELSQPSGRRAKQLGHAKPRSVGAINRPAVNPSRHGPALAGGREKAPLFLARFARWLYHYDEWAKRHSIFQGLQAGGLMDCSYYRELIPDVAFASIEPATDAVAGGVNASWGCQSGLMVAV